MEKITLTHEVDMDELVGFIESSTGLDYDAIIKFILDIDAAVADYDFTVALRDKLNEIIKKCDEESDG
jgi:hypothetical protein